MDQVRCQPGKVGEQIVAFDQVDVDARARVNGIAQCLLPVLLWRAVRFVALSCDAEVLPTRMDRDAGHRPPSTADLVDDV